MLTDSVNGKKNDGTAKESVQVVDVAQLLLDSVRTPVPVGAAVGGGSENGPDGGDGGGEADGAAGVAADAGS
jgi:hypothetical protein